MVSNNYSNVVWCPYTGGDGRKDFMENGEESWARCLGPACPKAEISDDPNDDWVVCSGGVGESYLMKQLSNIEKAIIGLEDVL